MRRGTIDFVIQKWINQRYYKWGEYTTSNHSLIAENGRIYSWGHHFPIAKWIDQNHILFNPEEYEMAEARSGKSMSTERHKRKVLQALPADVKVIYGHPTSEMCAYRWFRDEILAAKDNSRVDWLRTNMEDYAKATGTNIEHYAEMLRVEENKKLNLKQKLQDALSKASDEHDRLSALRQQYNRGEPRPAEILHSTARATRRIVALNRANALEDFEVATTPIEPTQWRVMPEPAPIPAELLHHTLNVQHRDETEIPGLLIGEGSSELPELTGWEEMRNMFHMHSHTTNLPIDELIRQARESGIVAINSANASATVHLPLFQERLEYARQMAEIDNWLERLNSMFADFDPPVTRHDLILRDGSRWSVSADGTERTRIQ